MTVQDEKVGLEVGTEQMCYVQDLMNLKGAVLMHIQEGVSDIAK